MRQVADDETQEKKQQDKKNMEDALGLRRRHYKGSDSSTRALVIERLGMQALARRMIVQGPHDKGSEESRPKSPADKGLCFSLHTRQGINDVL